MPPPPPAKPVPARRLLLRALLLGVALLLLRLAFVAAVHGRACDDSGDFCLFSSPPPTAASSCLAALRPLAASGRLPPAARALCATAAAPPPAAAALRLTVAALGVSLAVAGDLLRHPPFAGEEFDFVFADHTTLDSAGQPLAVASELARVLRTQGFLALHAASAGDPYSLQSIQELFPGFRFLHSQEIGTGIGLDSMVLREIVLQKEAIGDGIGILESNSTNGCEISEHKVQMVQSAEPLIQEEPLKPWITLKKNLKNIKYLSLIADISFKRKYVYIDVGARSYGSSIGSWFKKQYPKQNRTFDIYAIEADKAFHDQYASKKGVNLVPLAAWVRNETLRFEINQELGHRDDREGRGMGRIRPVGEGSSQGSSEVHSIRGFDFAAWLKRTVSRRDYVVMKMDVEGTEFDLVPRLFETGAICLVDELFLECHYNRWQKCCPGVRSPKYQNTYEECMELFTSLRESGVFVHQWW